MTPTPILETRPELSKSYVTRSGQLRIVYPVRRKKKSSGWNWTVIATYTGTAITSVLCGWALWLIGCWAWENIVQFFN